MKTKYIHEKSMFNGENAGFVYTILKTLNLWKFCDQRERCALEHGKQNGLKKKRNKYIGTDFHVCAVHIKMNQPNKYVSGTKGMKKNKRKNGERNETKM